MVERVYEYLAGDEKLKELLALFDGRAAVFHQRVPARYNDKWMDECFPRLDFSIDWFEEKKSGVSGSLIINIWCAGKSAEPEKIERAVKGKLDRAFVKAEGGARMGFFWARTDGFESGAKDNAYGSTMLFEIESFPVEENRATVTLNSWSKERFTSLALLGELPEDGFCKATDERPILAWRIHEEISAEAMFACRFFEGEARAFLYAPGENRRREISDALFVELGREGHLLMDNEGPLLIKNVLSSSEVRVLYRYGRVDEEKIHPPGEALMKLVVRHI